MYFIGKRFFYWEEGSLPNVTGSKMVYRRLTSEGNNPRKTWQRSDVTDDSKANSLRRPQ